jgi:hypothetical protein
MKNKESTVCGGDKAVCGRDGVQSVNSISFNRMALDGGKYALGSEGAALEGEPDSDAESLTVNNDELAKFGTVTNE